MVTIHDVAKAAEVSIATVSYVINGTGKVSQKTVDKVNKIIKELNYIPNSVARGLKTNKTKSIGIIAEDLSCFSTPEVVDGISEYCEEHGYVICLNNLRFTKKMGENRDYSILEQDPIYKDSLKKNLNSLITSRVSGIIYIGTHPRDLSRLMPDLNLPVVYTYGYSTKEGSYNVNYDDFQGAKEAVDYIVSQNHKKIGLISGAVNSVPAHKRMMGYQTALMEHNVQFRPEYVSTGNWLYDDGYNACEKLLSLQEPPTAIFAMSDLMAYGAIDCAIKRGLKVPEDISIHGFDNLQFSMFTKPPLTTIDLPLHSMGSESAKVIIDLVEGQEIDNKETLVQCIHVIRDSVKQIYRT